MWGGFVLSIHTRFTIIHKEWTREGKKPAFFQSSEKEKDG
jgi:hypothetical protein